MKPREKDRRLFFIIVFVSVFFIVPDAVHAASISLFNGLGRISAPELPEDQRAADLEGRPLFFPLFFNGANIIPGTPPPTWDAEVESYPGNSKVSYQGKWYVAKWWIGKGQCPILSDCPDQYPAGTTQEQIPWAEYTAQDEIKLAAYQNKYNTLTMPAANQCTLNAGETTLEYAHRLITNRVGGELQGLGLADGEIEAMKRAYYLPCEVPFTINMVGGRVSTTADDTATWPANVKTVNTILPEALWDEITAKKFQVGEGRTGPIEASTFGYAEFLRQIARAPYFCGETGPFYTNLKESCARELAALLAHATQETGDAGQYGSLLFFTREDGAYPKLYNISTPFNTVGANYWTAGTCNTDLLRCPDGSRAGEVNEIPYYFGRGLHQTTWYYNYVNLAAAYFGGSHYDFLIRYPDLVGRKGGLSFASGIVFAVTPVTPKPSMHEVMLGIQTYQPTECLNDTVCGGLIFDPGTKMVKNPFLVTTSIINGQYECTYPGDPESSQMAQSRNRTKLFVTLLRKLLGSDATFSADEKSLCTGDQCLGCPIKAGDVFGTYEKMRNHNRMFVNFNDQTCPAATLGANPPLSFYYDGILDLCKAMHP